MKTTGTGKDLVLSTLTLCALSSPRNQPLTAERRDAATRSPLTLRATSTDRSIQILLVSD